MFKDRLKFYCFSPPVMLVTFLLEISFAAYVLWRYHMTAISRLVVAILVFLAIFQGTEFMLCGGLAFEGGTWSRIGYSSITILPPLGVHLAYAIAQKKAGWLVAASYFSAALFIGYFAFVTHAVSGHTCYANYAVFSTSSGSSLWYTLYYYGWMLVGTYLTVRWAGIVSTNRRAALYALLAGYLALFIPTTTITALYPNASSGIPSIMCGFAIILAFLLTTRVAPKTVKVRKHSL